MARRPARGLSYSDHLRDQFDNWRGYSLLGAGAETASETVVGDPLAPKMVQYELEIRREREARDGSFSLGGGHPGPGQTPTTCCLDTIWCGSFSLDMFSPYLQRTSYGFPGLSEALFNHPPPHPV